MSRYTLGRLAVLLSLAVVFAVLVIGAVYFEFGGAVPAKEYMAAHPTTTLASRSIHLNTATKDELLRLPNMTNELADRILKYRTELGAFRSVDEVRTLPDVTEYLYLTWYPYLTL